MGTQQDGSAELRERQRQEQAEVLDSRAFSRGKLEHAQFIAAQTGFSQTKGGDIIITLLVPFEYRDQAAAMLDASGVPLSVDVIPWRRNAIHEEHNEW